MRPSDRPAAAGGVRRFLSVEDPVVDATETVEPHRVVEARDLEPGRDPRHSVPAQDGLEDRVIARIRQCCAVDGRVVRKRADRLQPHGLVCRVRALDAEVHRRGHVTHVERSAGGPHLRDRVIEAAEQVGHARKIFGLGEVRRHVDLVLQALVRVLERRDHREDRQAVLVGLRAAGGERPPVVDPVDRECDGLVQVAGAKEVTVHRVDDPALLKRALRGHERLREQPGRRRRGPAASTDSVR